MLGNILGNKLFYVCAFVVCLAGALWGLHDAKEPVAKQYEIKSDGSVQLDENTVAIHDPSVLKVNGEYYIFGTHLCSAQSDDLVSWKEMTAGVSDKNKTFALNGTLRETLSEPLSWTDAFQELNAHEENSWQTNIWAPDAIYNKEMGKYCYYASSSVWGTTASVIFMATSDTPEGPFEYENCIVYSGFNKQTQYKRYIRTNSMHFSFTNIGTLLRKGVFKLKDVENAPWFDPQGNYNHSVYPNCIDPNVFYDKDGNLWMSYGSFFGGIYLMPLCEETGMPDYQYMKNTDGFDMYFGKKIVMLTAENDLSGEGPYIIYDSESDYYYLYISYGSLSALGGYNIREYRSKTVDGPYLDAKGNSALDLTNTGVKLIGNYKFSGNNETYLAAGHSSCLKDEDGKLFQVYHTRTKENGESYKTTVHQMYKNADGWAVMLPFEYKGETVEKKGYSLSEIAGNYEFINHGSITNSCENFEEVKNIISPTQNITLNSNGTVSGVKIYKSEKGNTAVSEKVAKATWKATENSPYITLEINNVNYNGVLCRQKDEKGNEVLVFSLIGENNESIWAVKND